MKKRIFILNGHPAETSLNRAFAETYAKAARAAGHDVRVAHLHDLDFDADFGFAGYKTIKPLEPGLEEVLENIEWSEHVVLTTPMWWGGVPGKLKGLFDRVLLPGRTFDTHVPAGKMPKPMLTGRTGRVIVTADTPKFLLSLMYRNAMVNQLKGQVFKFVGITPTKITYLAGASHPKEGSVARWMRKISAYGAAAA